MSESRVILMKYEQNYKRVPSNVHRPLYSDRCRLGEINGYFLFHYNVKGSKQFKNIFNFNHADMFKPTFVLVSQLVNKRET